MSDLTDLIRAKRDRMIALQNELALLEAEFAEIREALGDPDERRLRLAAAALADVVESRQSTPAISGPVALPPAASRVTPSTPTRSTAEAPADDPDTAVLAVLAHAAQPMRSGEIGSRVGLSSVVTARVVKRLRGAGLVEMSGLRAAAVYRAVPNATSLQTARPSEEPASYVETPTEEPTVPAVARAAQETAVQQLSAKYAFYLLQHVFVDERPYHIGDLVLKVHDRFGQSDYQDVLAACEGLVKEGACVPIVKGGGRYYRRTPKADAVDPMAAVMSALRARAFLYVRDHGFGDLVELVKDVPGATTHLVQRALDEMVSQRVVNVRTVGRERRYAKRVA